MIAGIKVYILLDQEILILKYNREVVMKLYLFVFSFFLNLTVLKAERLAPFIINNNGEVELTGDIDPLSFESGRIYAHQNDDGLESARVALPVSSLPGMDWLESFTDYFLKKKKISNGVELYGFALLTGTTLRGKFIDPNNLVYKDSVFKYVVIEQANQTILPDNFLQLEETTFQAKVAEIKAQMAAKGLTGRPYLLKWKIQNHSMTNILKLASNFFWIEDKNKFVLAADRDSDGVQDVFDKCGNTPLGQIPWYSGKWAGCAGGQVLDAPTSTYHYKSSPTGSYEFKPKVVVSSNGTLFNKLKKNTIVDSSGVIYSKTKDVWYGSDGSVFQTTNGVTYQTGGPGAIGSLPFTGKQNPFI